MEKMAEIPELAPLNALVGEWATEATHPAHPSTVVRGHATFEWLEGERFLVQRSRNDHPDFPDAIAITGAGNGGLAMYYFDSRGVQRVDDVSMREGVWRLSRDAPGFSQRFTGTLDAGADTIDCHSEVSRDGSTWSDDLAITYRRRPSPGSASR